MNVAHLIAWSAKQHAGRLAFEFSDEQRTYAEVESRANRFAHALRALGVRTGDRVGVLIGNQIEYAEAEFGVTISGAARVPMLTAATAPELVRYVAFSEAVAVVASSECLAALRVALAEVEHQVKVIAIGGAEGHELDFESLLAAQPDIASRDAFVLRTLLIHEYRRVLLKSTELPPDLLPDPWPGHAARALTATLYRRVHGAASVYCQTALENTSGPLPPPAPDFHLRFGGLP